MSTNVTVDLAEPLHGSAERELVIAPIASVGFEAETPEYGVFWRVLCDDYSFEAGQRQEGGAFYIRRNGHEARTKPPSGKIKKCSVLFTWSPEWLRVFLRAQVTGLDGREATLIDEHELRTPACIAPNKLILWARERMLAPIAAYDTYADFRDTVLSAVSSLEDTITKTRMQRSFWDTQRDGNTITARIPKREPECLPLIHALLSGIAIQKNLDISPEHPSGAGNLDFLITGSLKDHSRVKACVEFKRAHSDRLEHGIASQLPAYMKANACDFGIYVVLYFRGQEFDEPKLGVPDLLIQVEKVRNGAGLQNIRATVINCAIPTPPSKL